jgi:hypothetical protein
MTYRSFASMSAGVISGIVHVLKSGGRIDAPDIHSPRKTPYTRFVRWAAILTDRDLHPLHLGY